MGFVSIQAVLRSAGTQFLRSRKRTMEGQSRADRMTLAIRQAEAFARLQRPVPSVVVDQILRLVRVGTKLPLNTPAAIRVLVQRGEV